MTGDFVAEAGDAIVRMQAERRRRQLYTAIGGAVGTLALLYWCTGLGFVVMAGTVVGLLWLEFYGDRLEKALETVGESREFFVSSKDGLFLATPGFVFVEKMNKLFPYEDKRRSVAKVDYDASAHQLHFLIHVRHPAMEKGAAAKQERFSVACPRALSSKDAEALVKQIERWASASAERTLP